MSKAEQWAELKQTAAKWAAITDQFVASVPPDLWKMYCCWRRENTITFHEEVVPEFAGLAMFATLFEVLSSASEENIPDDCRRCRCAEGCVHNAGSRGTVYGCPWDPDGDSCKGCGLPFVRPASTGRSAAMPDYCIPCLRKAASPRVSKATVIRVAETKDCSVCKGDGVVFNAGRKPQNCPGCSVWGAALAKVTGEQKADETLDVAAIREIIPQMPTGQGLFDAVAVAHKLEALCDRVETLEKEIERLNASNVKYAEDLRANLDLAPRMVAAETMLRIERRERAKDRATFEKELRQRDGDVEHWREEAERYRRWSIYHKQRRHQEPDGESTTAPPPEAMPPNAEPPSVSAILDDPATHVCALCGMKANWRPVNMATPGGHWVCLQPGCSNYGGEVPKTSDVVKLDKGVFANDIAALRGEANLASNDRCPAAALMYMAKAGRLEALYNLAERQAKEIEQLKQAHTKAEQENAALGEAIKQAQERHASLKRRVADAELTTKIYDQSRQIAWNLAKAELGDHTLLEGKTADALNAVQALCGELKTERASRAAAEAERDALKAEAELLKQALKESQEALAHEVAARLEAAKRAADGEVEELRAKLCLATPIVEAVQRTLAGHYNTPKGVATVEPGPTIGTMRLARKVSFSPKKTGYDRWINSIGEFAEALITEKWSRVGSLYADTVAATIVQGGHEGTGPDIWDLVIDEVSQRSPRGPESDEVWSIRELVIADMRARQQFGHAKHGRPLRAGDGRDSLVDAYQEDLDSLVYKRKAVEEGRACAGLYQRALEQVHATRAQIEVDAALARKPGQ